MSTSVIYTDTQLDFIYLIYHLLSILRRFELRLNYNYEIYKIYYIITLL